MRRDVSAIIVAAGRASRMQGIDKQWMPLGGRPVLLHSILTFSEIPCVAEVIVVTKQQDVERLTALLKGQGLPVPFSVIAGGDARQDSVARGVGQCSTESTYLAIHDGARPLIEARDILSVIADARLHCAATLGVKVKETIKTVDKNRQITGTPERETLYLTQTPQVFETELYQKGMQFAQGNGIEYTDDCQLIEALGVPVYMCAGQYSNIKITTPEDVAVAEAIYKGQKRTGEVE